MAGDRYERKMTKVIAASLGVAEKTVLTRYGTALREHAVMSRQGV